MIDYYILLLSSLLLLLLLLSHSFFISITFISIYRLRPSVKQTFLVENKKIHLSLP